MSIPFETGYIYTSSSPSKSVALDQARRNNNGTSSYQGYSLDWSGETLTSHSMAVWMMVVEFNTLNLQSVMIGRIADVSTFTIEDTDRPDGGKPFAQSIGEYNQLGLSDVYWEAGKNLAYELSGIVNISGKYGKDSDKAASGYNAHVWRGAEDANYAYDWCWVNGVENVCSIVDQLTATPTLNAVTMEFTPTENIKAGETCIVRITNYIRANISYNNGRRTSLVLVESEEVPEGLTEGYTCFDGFSDCTFTDSSTITIYSAYSGGTTLVADDNIQKFEGTNKFAFAPVTGAETGDTVYLVITKSDVVNNKPNVSRITLVETSDGVFNTQLMDSSNTYFTESTTITVTKMKSNYWYFCEDRSKFVNYTESSATNVTDFITNHVNDNEYIEIGPSALAIGFIKEVYPDAGYILSKTVGASPVTYFSDYQSYLERYDSAYINSSCFGGSRVSGFYAGPFALVLNTYPSFSIWNLGALLTAKLYHH